MADRKTLQKPYKKPHHWLKKTATASIAITSFAVSFFADPAFSQTVVLQRPFSFPTPDRSEITSRDYKFSDTSNHDENRTPPVTSSIPHARGTSTIIGFTFVMSGDNLVQGNGKGDFNVKIAKQPIPSDMLDPITEALGNVFSPAPKRPASPSPTMPADTIAPPK